MANLQKVNLLKSQLAENTNQSILVNFVWVDFGKLSFWKLTISPNIVNTGY